MAPEITCIAIVGDLLFWTFIEIARLIQFNKLLLSVQSMKPQGILFIYGFSSIHFLFFLKTAPNGNVKHPLDWSCSLKLAIMRPINVHVHRASAN